MAVEDLPDPGVGESLQKWDPVFSFDGEVVIVLIDALQEDRDVHEDDDVLAVAGCCSGKNMLQVTAKVSLKARFS